MVQGVCLTLARDVQGADVGTHFFFYDSPDLSQHALFIFDV